MNLNEKLIEIIKNDEIILFKNEIEKNIKTNLNKCFKACCVYDSINIANFLIEEKNVDVTYHNNINFINTCYFGCIKVTKLLLKNKNNDFYNNHNFPFNSACSSSNNNSDDIAKLLLIKCPQINCIDSIVSAARFNNIELLKILFKHDNFINFNFDIKFFKNPDKRLGLISVLIKHYPQIHKDIISYFNCGIRNYKELEIIKVKIEKFNKIENVKNKIKTF